MTQPVPGPVGRPVGLAGSVGAGSAGAGSSGTSVGGVDLDLAEGDPAGLARLVLSCPAVVAMHGGVVGEAATYLPGARVTGLRVLPARVEVHVVVRWPVPADEVAAQVLAVTGQLVGGRRVDVVIGDVLLPETDQIR